MSYNLTYSDYFARYYSKNNKYNLSIKKEFKTPKNLNNFHTSNQFSKMRKTFYDYYKLSPFQISSNDFIQKFYNGDIDIDVSGKTIKIKDNTEIFKSQILRESSLIKDQMKHTNYYGMLLFKKRMNEQILNIRDYKEIEKSISDDKKLCEKCGVFLFGENFHKGWKNDNGDYVLLCDSCSKKYFAGANEIKYEKREENISNMNNNQISNKNDYSNNNNGENNYYNSGNGNNSNSNYYKNDFGNQAHKGVNFLVYNTNNNF